MSEEDYISGFLDCISRVKDILTPQLGGTNQFFLIDKKPKNDNLENVKRFLVKNRKSYTWIENDLEFESWLNSISISKINDWQIELPKEIKIWTSDRELVEISGKNGYLLSEYLVNFLLKDLFQDKEVEVFKLLPEWEKWHWGDQINQEYLFVTNDNMFIMHLGESS